MGYVQGVGAHSFPRQSEHVGQRTAVRFYQDFEELGGTVVRDDLEYPWRTIIQLDDGRFVMSIECVYRAPN